MVEGYRRGNRRQRPQSQATLFFDVTIGKQSAHLITNPADVGAPALLPNIADDRREVFVDHIVQSPAFRPPFERSEAPPDPAMREVPDIEPLAGQIAPKAVL